MHKQIRVLSPHLVIIPTYNEIENIEQIIRAVLVRNCLPDVLIVDDGSPDGTAAKVKEMAQEFKDRIHLLERKEKNGLGRAYIAGFKWALDQNYDTITEMDADFSHPPEKIDELIGQLTSDKSDVAVGSRYTSGGGVVNWPWFRLFLSRAASIYVQLITGMGIKDPTAGFVSYKREVLSAINLDSIKFVGYAFQIEMKYAAYRLGYHISEIPILFPDREKGKSKMHIFIIGEALSGVFAMRFLRSYKRYKKNISA